MDALANSKAGAGHITGIFPDRTSAERVFDAIRDRGYDKDEINLLMTDDTRKAYYADVDPSTGERSDMGDRAMEGAGVGSAIGGTIGAIVGAVAAIGTSLVLPGVGLIIAGPVAAALAGAGAGGLTGGLLGALVGSGIPEDEARDYEENLKSGGTAILVTPHSAEDAHFLRDLFSRNSTNNVYDSHLRTSDPDYFAKHSPEGGRLHYPRQHGTSHRVTQTAPSAEHSTASIPGILGETYQGSNNKDGGVGL